MIDALQYLYSPPPGFGPADDDGYLPVIESDVPVPERNARTASNQDKVALASSTATIEGILKEQQDGTAMEITEADARLARSLFNSGQDITAHELAHEPEAMIKLHALMSDYDKRAVADAHKIRNYVTNRLVLASNSKNETISMRALENLGKLSDVGAFVERREITINNQSTESLEETLRSKIDKILGKPVEGVVLHAEEN